MQNLQQKKSALTRAKILAAAETEFSEKGFYGARIDSVAKLAGVNKRMIYEHFTSKELLYKTVLVGVYDKLAEKEREFFVDDIEPVLAIKNIVYVYSHFLEQNPTFVRMLMWENLNKGQYIDKEAVRTLKLPTVNYIKAQVKRGKEQGVFRSDADEHQIVVSLMNFVFSYFSNIYTLSSVLDFNMSDSNAIAKRAEFVSDMIVKSILK